MKKYLVASVVAVMVFAFAAFAASLNVTAPTLQFGATADGELVCTENADITAWLYNDHLEGGPVSGATIELDDGHECEGDRLYLSVLGEDGEVLANNSTVIGTGSTLQLGIPDDSALADATNSDISSADVYGAQIGIDQGY